ncbi:DUF2784 domain-containing protein [Umezawaea tangerina]|uniref:Uncharacterized protein DUF2784 n=1 Tax=Umezawaea tangerina TaxID=84725 RepID=A0A2T0SGT7_9PSEU|nr:DUF2784 domain-containing protein [Umezawaea tangerina]PRY32615.1 uncharacterized protein DUF2784 [Umezawaea tangerina]
MVSQALAELIMIVHFAVLVFLVVGGFLARHWRGLIYPHLAMATWGILVVAFPLNCPLTAAENFFRTRAGQPELVDGFIDHYIDGVVYPQSAAGIVQLLVAVLVLGSWTGYYRKWRGERHAGANHVGAH